MRRLAVNLLTWLSLLLFVAGCALWVRSYFVQDVLVFALPDGTTATVVHSNAGSFLVMGRDGSAFPASVEHLREEVGPLADAEGLITFLYDRNPTLGMRAIVFPQWAAVAPCARVPVARLTVRRRRRRRSAARGFPVNAAEPTA